MSSRRRAAISGLLGAAVAGALVLAVAAGWLAPMAGRLPGLALAGSSAAAPPPGWHAVRYQGVSLDVPGSWPVVNLPSHPLVCPRLDVHAVYLGIPGPHPRCPASGLGARTTAVQITPVIPGSPQVVGATRAITVGGTPALTSPQVGAGHTITLVFPGVRAQVSLSFGASQALARRIQATIRVTHRAAGVQPFSAVPRAALPAARAQGIVKGYGFDACSAPSSGAMKAWLASKYRSVGVYIGGADEACSQPFLTSSWISTAERRGWHVFPLYAGPQAPCVDAPGNLTFSASNAKAAGAAAGSDAASQARNLRLPAGTPVIYDMEAYGGCGSAVTTFLNAWDRRLRSHGYAGGVYESTGNVGDLARAKGHMKEPWILFYANWDGRATTNSPYIPGSMWTNHQRIHQYTGNVTQTFGGVTLNIDQDRLNVNMGGVVGASGKPQTAVVDSGGIVRVYDRGASTGPLWEDHLGPASGSSWSWFNMKGTWPFSPTAILGSDGTVHVFAVGTTGHLYERHLPRGGNWSGWASLSGKWQSNIAAVAESSGTARVFAVGTDGHLYTKHLRSDGTWSGWQTVGGSRLTGTPAVTFDATGTTHVFVRSATGALRVATLAPGSPWGWANLHGSWRYDPAAVAFSDGSARVYAVGTDGRLYQKHLRTSGTWSSWYRVGASRLTGTPAAVTDQTGTIRVFTRITTGSLREEYLAHGSPWAGANLHGIWHFDPSAVVDGSDIVRVYALGTTGHLYEDHLRVGRNWSGWFDLGGH